MASAPDKRSSLKFAGARQGGRPGTAISILLPLPGVVLLAVSSDYVLVWSLCYALLALVLLASAGVLHALARRVPPGTSEPPRGLRRWPLVRLGIIAGITAAILALVFVLFLVWIVSTWPAGVP